MGVFRLSILPSAKASPTRVEVKDFAMDHEANRDLPSAPPK